MSPGTPLYSVQSYVMAQKTQLSASGTKKCRPLRANLLANRNRTAKNLFAQYIMLICLNVKRDFFISSFSEKNGIIPIIVFICN